MLWRHRQEQASAAAHEAGMAVLAGQTASRGAAEDEQVQQILTDVVTRRAAGEVLSEQSVIAAHPALAGRLRHAFSLLDDVHRAHLAAARAGAVADPMAPLSASDLACPIDALIDTAAAQAMDDGALDRHVLIPGYRILAPISGGGQATVYQAIQESTGRRVAIKVLRGGPFVASHIRARFDREVDALAQLSHPHIVQVLDRGRTADGSFFFTMEFIDGLTLDAWIDQAPDLPSVLRVLAKVADAVEEAHCRGIIHRDLKPSNVRMDGRGDPHVLDFGLARAMGSDLPTADVVPITMTGQLVGSLPWSSPEQAGGSAHQVGPASDIYSMGVMLYHAMTGRFPYPVNGPVRQILKNIETAVPPRPSRIGFRRPVRHPAAWDAVVLRALEKEPGNRFASAAALRDALLDLAAGRTPALPQSRRTAERSRWRSFIAVGSVFLIVGVAAILKERNQFGVIRLPGHVNSAGMMLVKIPPGTFQMGSPAMEEGRSWRERLVPAVLDTYWIGTTEVTRAQFARVMQLPPPPSEAENLPADDVSIETARDFCARLSEKEGRIYRLPTEAEWEYACRAGTVTPVSGTGDLDEMGWYLQNAEATLHPVAQKRPNHWGLYDMHGNVSELADTDWLERLGEAADRNEARDRRVVRGGNVDADADDCRSAARGSIAPDQHWPHLGFRVVMVAD